MEIKLIVKASWSVKLTSRNKQETRTLLARKDEICYEEELREYLHFVKLKIKEYKYCVPTWSPREPSSLQAMPMAEEPVILILLPTEGDQKLICCDSFSHILTVQRILMCACACVILIAF